MIIRTIHNKDNPYFQLNRATVNDERLSYRAIGIHTYLMSKPDGWQANEADIVNRHTEGRDAVRAGLKELAQYGYLHRTRVTDKAGKVVEWRIDVYETPELNPYFTKNERPENSAQVTENPELENQDCGQPDYWKTTMWENQNVENQPHSKYIYRENKEEKKVDVAPPPVIDSTGDPLVDTAKRKWQAGKKAPVQSWQAELNLELEAKRRVPLAQELARVSGWEALIDAGDDKKNEECHRAAIFLYKMGVVTPDDLKDWYADYLSDTWARDKNPNPRPEKVKELVSKKAAAKAMPVVRPTNGNTASYRAAPSDLFGMEQ